MPQPPTSDQIRTGQGNPELSNRLEKTPLPTESPTPTASPRPTSYPSPTPTPLPSASATSAANTSTPLENPTQSPKASTLEAINYAAPVDVPASSFPFFPVAIALFVAVAAVFTIKRLAERLRYGKNAGKGLRSLKKAVSVKNELTKRWLKKNKSANIHAIGVGKIDGTDEYCVQVFVDDANAEMLEDPPTQFLPAEFRGLPIVIYEMPRADFLTSAADEARFSHEVLKGGISGANSQMSGGVGTIGYFFRPTFIDQAASVFLKKHIYLLSNAHVFADLTNEEINEDDLIVHPSPGDNDASRVVAALYAKTPLLFDGDVENPNILDGAIAKLNRGISHMLEIPRIGQISEYLRKDKVELRSRCAKFGRTTAYTKGIVFSIHLSIWVKYSARGKEAFFSDQFLVVPTDNSSFVKPGDSGSLLVDNENRAIGLIFAGAGEQTILEFHDADPTSLTDLTPKIDHFGVANPICDVMSHFKIRLDK